MTPPTQAADGVIEVRAADHVVVIDQSPIKGSRRSNPATYSGILEYRLRSADTAEVLSMTIDQASEFFTEKSVRPMLRPLADVGFGYLTLGQPLTTLSGGERQRLRLGIEMSRGASTYVLDEPTSGLHLADVDLPADGESLTGRHLHRSRRTGRAWAERRVPTGAVQSGSRSTP